MALFTKKTKDSAHDPNLIQSEDQILGYLDEVFRQRNPLTIRTREKSNKWICNLYFIDVKKKLLRIEDSGGLVENEKKVVQCGFSLDRTWFIFQARIVFFYGKPHLTIPNAIKRHERRRHPRMLISAREQVKVSLLESLGAGVGIMGLACDIGVGGLCIYIERAMALESEKIIRVHDQLLPKGSQLMVIQIANLSGLKKIQVQGIVNRIFRDGAKWKMAVEFTGLNPQLKMAIDSAVKAREIPFKLMSRSYKKRQEVERERAREQQQQKEQQKSENTDETPDTTKRTAEPGPESMAEPPAPKPHREVTGLLRAAVGLPPEKPEPPLELDITPPEPTPPTPTPAPAPAAPAPGKPSRPQLLSIGDHLAESLKFLQNVKEYDWVHVDTPMKIIKYLNGKKVKFLMLPRIYKEQSMVQYLEKISTSGILKNVGVVLFSDEPVPPRELIKCRMMGIQHTIQMPLRSPSQVLDIILPKPG